MLNSILVISEFYEDELILHKEIPSIPSYNGVNSIVLFGIKYRIHEVVIKITDLDYITHLQVIKDK